MVETLQVVEEGITAPDRHGDTEWPLLFKRHVVSKRSEWLPSLTLVKSAARR